MKRISPINSAHTDNLISAESTTTPNRPYFPIDTPVAYNAAKEVVSRYGDRSWDLRSMSTDGTSAFTLHFPLSDAPALSPLSTLIYEQHKALMWLHMDAGDIRAPRTLRFANLALRAWSRKAENYGVDLFTILTHPEWMTQELKGMNQTYLYSTTSLINTLWRQQENLGIRKKIQLQTLRRVLSKESKTRPQYRQTPLIPSRVYCEILACLINRMEIIEGELELLLNAYTKCKQASRSISETSSAQQPKAHKRNELSSIINQLNFLGYDPMGEVPIQQFITTRIGLHQVTLMTIVIAFSGMRIGEASILPLDKVLAEFQQYGSVHYELQGYTHKFNEGVKQSASWITSHQGARAVKLAQRIARKILQEHKIPPEAGQQALLFPSTENPYMCRESKSVTNHRNSLREIICPIITQSDIDELDSLEMENSWERDDIEVDLRWPLTFHQLRRSLAVYAHRSGMVSLPALKAQLKHITEEMALYYSDGFSRAVNLVFDKNHFSHEWNAAKSESSYYAYALSVLFNDDNLLGRGSQHMANVIESRSQEDTFRLFQENKIAYRETPLGGCVSTEPCKIEPMEPIPYQCLEKNCINQVVSSKRLDHIIQFQESAVASLERNEHGSVEHRLEARHLEILLTARERLTKGVE